MARLKVSAIWPASLKPGEVPELTEAVDFGFERVWNSLTIEARQRLLDHLLEGPTNLGMPRPAVGRPDRAETSLREAGFLRRESVAHRDCVVFPASVRPYLERLRRLAQRGPRNEPTPEELEWAAREVLERAGVTPLTRGRSQPAEWFAHPRWLEWAFKATGNPEASAALWDCFEPFGDHPVRLSDLFAQVPTAQRLTLGPLLILMGRFQLVCEWLDRTDGLIRRVRRFAAPPRRSPLARMSWKRVEPVAVSPETGLLIQELRALLLELIVAPLRVLKSGHGFYATELKRFAEVLPPRPDWLDGVFNGSRDSQDRLAELVAHAAAAGLVQEVATARRGDLEEPRIELTEAGRDWLRADPSQRRRLLFESLSEPPSSNRFLYLPSFGLVRRIADARFLGDPVLVRAPVSQRADTKIKVVGEADRPEWDLYRDLRATLGRLFMTLPEGHHTPLSDVIDQFSRPEHNPLLLEGRRPRPQIHRTAFESQPLNQPEQIRQCAERLVRNHLLLRLVPWGAVQLGVDARGKATVRRLPALREWFRAAGADPVAQADGQSDRDGGETAPPQREPPTRVVVQPDFSVMVIGPDDGPVVDLRPYSQGPSGPIQPGSVVFKLTRESVQRAVVQGHSLATLLAVLQTRSDKTPPANVIRQLETWGASVRSVTAELRILLRCDDAETADRVMAALGKAQVERLTPTLVALQRPRLGTAEENRLREQGVRLLRGDTPTQASRARRRRRD
ncbi:hypothetical protein Isop_3618 [Isosphaera pallida ATCC 43644]|uniref:Helicase XPB/Ssl2 N-terminal domain-containing protein n=1 Tax=Isosphaera pallida (strain ATCC 43644 / DSM 9630 / IS1B) TaxID=575540 RepID=E8QYJ2_ISOPI|nr:hypothetical protein [Isosphaera pallida]ADV64175.1 hypothetical protein Isop_3618 [Isosphaera pallida ATCC 43644]